MENPDYKVEMLPEPEKELPSGAEEKTTHQEQQTNNSHEVQTLLSWSAPGRPFRKKSRQFYSTVILIALLFEVILFLFSQYTLMFVVVALVFVSFVLVSVPPRNFQYRISSEGVTVEDHFYLWRELYDFYFRKRDDQDILCIRTVDMIPGVLTITLGEMPADHAKGVLLPYLPFRELIKPTFIEKSSNWLSRNFPLEGKA